jgi:hypothetical protein
MIERMLKKHAPFKSRREYVCVNHHHREYLIKNNLQRKFFDFSHMVSSDKSI